VRDLNTSALAKYCKNSDNFQIWQDWIFNKEAMEMLNSHIEQFIKEPEAIKEVLGKGLKPIFDMVLENLVKTPIEYAS
jgi:hypothetical protein